MSDQKMNKTEEKEGVNPVIVAVAGAIVGAGVAVAGAVLSDKKNREMIARTVTKVKEDASHLVAETQKQITTEKKALEKRISDDQIKVKKVVASAQDSLHKTTKEVNNAVKSL